LWGRPLACGGLAGRSQTLEHRGVPVALFKREAEKTPAPASGRRRPASVHRLPLARQSSSTAPLSGLESDFRRSIPHHGTLARSRSLRLPDHARCGPTFLRQPAMAQLVPTSIQYGSVSKLLGSLKAATAKRANLLLQRSGQPFWQDESYDRLVRDGDEFRRIQRYIEANPVAALLACRAGGLGGRRRPWACPTRVGTPDIGGKTGGGTPPHFP
jgi:hypothetical protein